MPEMVDWDLAARTGIRLAGTGPAVPMSEARAAVADLHRLAGEADGHVRAFTRLTPPTDVPPVAVVDRPTWIRSNVAGFRQVLTPIIDELSSRRPHHPTGATALVGRTVTGAQVGVLLSYLSGRVLGQYEIFVPADSAGRPGPGRLLLVAPNIVAVERAMAVDPRDFRLWVCLHEVTHRTQFTAVPWLRGYVEDQMAAFVDATDLDPAALANRLRTALGGVVEAVRGRGEASILELVQTPEQRVVLDRVQAFMSLVEGHAEYVMDGVGPRVIPSLARIRRRFTARRAGTSPLDKAVRRLLGIDLKMRQYADGARFVRAVVEAVGMDDFNRVWTSPQTLPTRREIGDAHAWVDRVIHDRPAITA